jgi:hypothetical protein
LAAALSDLLTAFLAGTAFLAAAGRAAAVFAFLVLAAGLAALLVFFVTTALFRYSHRHTTGLVRVSLPDVG